MLIQPDLPAARRMKFSVLAINVILTLSGTRAIIYPDKDNPYSSYSADAFVYFLLVFLYMRVMSTPLTMAT